MSGKLNARGLIAQELHDEMINGQETDSKKAAKLVNFMQKNLSSDPNPEAYLKNVCTALKDIGEKPIADTVDSLERISGDLIN